MIAGAGSVPAVRRIVEIASHAVLGDAPLVNFHRVGAGGRSPAPAPAFLFGPVGPAMARAIYGQIETPEVGVFAVVDAVVAPTGIALRDGTAFCGEALNLPRAHVDAVTRRLAEAIVPVRHVEGPLVALFGPAEEAVVPLMVDYLPRLWLLEQAGYRLEDVRLLVPAELPRHVEDLLAGLGLREDGIVRYAHWREVIRTDMLLLPTVMRRHDRLAPGFGAASRFWTRRVAAGAGGEERRLFVAGGDGAPRWALAERIAVAQGFAVVRPEGRARAFGGATHVVGVEGDALYDAVFARAGTRVCVLREVGREGGFCWAGWRRRWGRAWGMCLGRMRRIFGGGWRFCSWSKEEFFFEKKNQKTFAAWGASVGSVVFNDGGSGGLTGRRRRRRRESTMRGAGFGTGRSARPPPPRLSPTAPRPV